MPARTKTTTETTSANLGFEAKRWLAADKLRNNMDAAEYKHVVLDLIFLKYISDTGGEIRMTNAECRIGSTVPTVAVHHSHFRSPLAATRVPRQAPQHRQGRGRGNVECRMRNVEF